MTIHYVSLGSGGNYFHGPDLLGPGQKHAIGIAPAIMALVSGPSEPAWTPEPLALPLRPERRQTRRPEPVADDSDPERQREERQPGSHVVVIDIA